MAHSIEPMLISSSQFEDYTKAWATLLDDNSSVATQSLQALFSTNGTLNNYVYLERKQLLNLLSAVGTKRVCVRLAIIPSPILLAVSLVVYCVDELGKPTSGYYMAGTRGEPAIVEDISADKNPYMSNGQISVMPAVSYMQVVDWVHRWQDKKPTDMSKDWFKSIYGNLKGYTYKLSDFWNSMLTAVQSESKQELWLSYILHEYAKPSEVDNSLLFGLVLTINPVQSDGSYKFVLSTSNYYYDVSRPCPPACG